MRGRGDSAEAIVTDINRSLAGIGDAKISALQPPPINNVGNSSGFSFRLQDRAQKGYAELMRAKKPRPPEPKRGLSSWRNAQGGGCRSSIGFADHSDASRARIVLKLDV